MAQKIESIQDWLIRHGHHPADMVNGEPLLDLLFEHLLEILGGLPKIGGEKRSSQMKPRTGQRSYQREIWKQND